MADFFLGIGFLLAIFGPLLFIPIIWLLHRFIMRPIFFSYLKDGHSNSNISLFSLAASLLIVFLIVAATYLPGKIRFDEMCSQYSTPVILKRVNAKGFYAEKLFPYQAEQILRAGDGFSFIEGPDMYNAGDYFRYTLMPDNSIERKEIEAPSAVYGVSDDLTTHEYGIIMSTKKIYERESGLEMAKAASIVYQGGPLSMLLGAYAMSTCPDVRTTDGSGHFALYYNLQRNVLGGRGGY